MDTIKYNINVLQELLNVARQVRPELYVVANLVTNSEEKENCFINRLRINSVIKGELHAYLCPYDFVMSTKVVYIYMY